MKQVAARNGVHQSETRTYVDVNGAVVFWNGEIAARDRRNKMKQN
jgi:hypothetical protein